MKRAIGLLIFALVCVSISAQVECHKNVYLKILEIEDPEQNGWVWDLTDDACEWLYPNVYNWELWGDEWETYKVTPEYYKLDGNGNWYINAHGVALKKYGTLPGEVDDYRFWFYFGCCGKEFCLDHDHLTYVTSEGYLKMADVNICYDTEVWVDMASQCYPCLYDLSGTGARDIMGQWWKYSRSFMANELLDYTNVSTPLGIELDYMGLVQCEEHTIYGCDHIK